MKFNIEAIIDMFMIVIYVLVIYVIYDIIKL